MVVNRILVQGSVEEYPRVVDDSSIEVVLRHDSVTDPFFFLVEAPFGLGPLAVSLLTLTPDDEVVVFGSLREGASPSASITIQAFALKSMGSRGNSFDEFATRFDDCPHPFSEFDEHFGELGLGDPDDEIPF